MKKPISKAKQNLIKKIKNIIKEVGSFSTADVEATSSPVIASIGKNTHQLAERFYNDGVTAMTYVHETETDQELMAYEKLDNDTLKEILSLAKDWKERNEDKL